MSSSDLTSVLLLLLLLVGLAQILGYLFARLRQPKVIGEILAGLVLGPSLIGRLPFASGLMAAIKHNETALSLFYWFGLLLLMFLSGTEARQLFGREERRAVTWLTVVGTGLPFALGLIFGGRLISPALAGPNGNTISLTIVLAVAVAVTSVPVVSKIFLDLKILNTRFARLVLGVAVLEDIVLWLALAVATAAAGHNSLNGRDLSTHLLLTISFFALGLTAIPRFLKQASDSRFNILARHSPVTYILSVLLGYCVLAGALNVSMVFAAFLAGFAVVHKERNLFAPAIQALSEISFAFFIPVYFSIVGLKLDPAHGFSFWMLITFFVGSCLVKLLSVSSAARIAGFRGLDLLNLAITMNARGGPGIVLASVSFEAGIISPKFYTTLVVAAVVTSQIAGVWLDFGLRRGWPLLASDRGAARHAVSQSAEEESQKTLLPTRA